jgi:biopolymer transport protein ExbD
MRVPDNLARGSLAFNMTPMIDVVFLLIIFFLVSSHLARQESHLDLPLPTAESGNRDALDNQPRVTVNVLRDGTLLLAGRPVDTERLERQLRQRMEDVGTNLQVRIRSDRAAPYRFVEPIMLACVEAGIWDVSFAVYRSEDVD